MPKSARRAAEQIADELDEMPLHFRVDKMETIIAAAIREDRAEMEAERDQLIEQLAIRSESGMAKDMQEIMRINNELNAALTSERQRREEAETALRVYRRRGNEFDPADVYFRKHEPIPADREEERGGNE